MANSKRKCKHCNEYSATERGVKVPVGWFCSTDHLIEFARKKAEWQRQREINRQRKKQETIKKAERSRHRKKKEALKTGSQWRSEAQAAVNKYIRIRDKFDPCISCGKPREEIESTQGWKVGGCWDAGHYMSRGAKGQLRFVLFNIHKQCKSCNGGSGKFSHKQHTTSEKYKENLIKKIGLDKVEWLENNNELDVRKNDIEYLKRVKRIFAKKTRLYEKRFR